MTANQSSCFISERPCNHLTPTKTVFIIGSGSREFKEDIKAIIDVLDGFSLEGDFALDNYNKKGEDAFCGKICSKIRESPFCVAMLNDPLIKRQDTLTRKKSEKIRAPRANVYYELGMAIALEKSVIPVIRAEFRLPFDIQILDTIKYKDLADLKEQLKKSILPTLLKKKKEFKTNNSKLVDNIYGPLYNEIVDFISKTDRFTRHSDSKYQLIRSHSKHLFDSVEEDLQEEIKLLYDKIKEFNSRLAHSARIIQKIVAENISIYFNVPLRPNLSIYIDLDTEDSGQVSPTINLILIRKTTPELYFETQGIAKKITKIKYRVDTPSHPLKNIDAETFNNFFEKLREVVESNRDIIDMRELEEQLRINGEGLKKKILQLCTQ